VTVNDIEDPEITCPANIDSVDNEPTYCDAVVTYDAATASDNCAATVQQTEGLAAGERFPVGTTTNVFNATDDADNFGKHIF
jgi:hypothetical protein